MKYEISKMLLADGENKPIIEDRITADIRFHIAVNGGTIEKEKLLNALFEENLFGDFVKSGYAKLSDGTFVRLVGFQYGKEENVQVATNMDM